MGHRLSYIYYFVDQRGNRPVKEFVASLPVREQAKVFSYFKEILRQGHNLWRPMADYLGDCIYELRPKDNRIFYFFFMKDAAVLPHAIKKKSDSIPQNDLSLCINRKIQVETYRNIERVKT